MIFIPVMELLSALVFRKFPQRLILHFPMFGAGRVDHPPVEDHVHANAFGDCASAYLNNLQTIDTPLFDYPTLVLNPAL